ncbi:hypothetical protein BC940DRAFT_233663 [Gongronella butleri]|nr:hypothetical protein BC940DRAFT_233663 [Gongronella butleri]
MEASGSAFPSDNDDEDDEDDDTMDWEDVALPSYMTGAGSSGHDEAGDVTMAEPEAIENEPATYKDVEVVVEGARRPMNKMSKMEMAVQRQLREWMHNSHVVLLISHFMVRNNWCAREDVQAVCLSVIPDHIQRQCKNKDASRDDFTMGIKWLLTWWHGYFTITGPGLVTRSHDEYDLREWDQHLHDNLLQRLGLQDTEIVADSLAFVNCLAEKKGTRDLSAQLFTALLRTLGFDTRLVCSLQPVPYRIPARRKESAPSKKENEEEEKDTPSEMAFPLRTSRATARLAYNRGDGDGDQVWKHKKAKVPTVWCEVWNPHVQRWQCVDPVRQLYNEPLLMEPGVSDRRNLLSMVLALECPERPQGKKRQRPRLCRAIDVTRRYTTKWQRALSLRERDLTKREREIGWQRWSDVLLNILAGSARGSARHDADVLRRLEREQEELASLEKHDALPSSLQGFRHHPVYALERHLKKHEVIHPPDTRVIGHIKGEKIYPRANVRTLHTRETWIKQGRVVRDGQDPVKKVAARAVTIEKKRILEEAKMQGNPIEAELFGEWQTGPYIAPPVVDGIVPKNAFGRVDLFTPEMLPKGAAHLEIQGIGRLARQLGIDFAECVVDFEFMRGRSLPVMNGIVVAEENKAMLLEAWREQEHHRFEKEQSKQQREAYKRWRKLLMGCMIDAHVERDYGRKKDDDNENAIQHGNATAWDRYLREEHGKKNDNDDDYAGGGFIRENDEDSHSAAGGGFLQDDEEEDDDDDILQRSKKRKGKGRAIVSDDDDDDSDSDLYDAQADDDDPDSDDEAVAGGFLFDDD